MVSLQEFINGAYSSSDSKSLYESYMNFGTTCIAVANNVCESEEIQEGLGSWLRKSAGVGDKIDSKLQQLSDAAKKAIENTKKAAGNAWDKVKDGYTAAVTAIDTALQKSKQFITDMSKDLGAKAEEIEGKVADTVMSIIQKGGNIGKAIQTAMQDTAKVGYGTMKGLTALVCGCVMVAKANANIPLADLTQTVVQSLTEQ